ncbi:MAG: hypothetical protein JWN34_4962 [Bryobacterales bacterium]|nr:hypothetical protein [Bryobacterales bacterium]
MSVLFSVLLIVPALASPSQETPQCCKRLGKHHCSEGKSSTNGPSVRSARCAQFQLQASTVAQHNAGVVGSDRLVRPGETDRLRTIAPQQRFTSASVSLIQTRGPPQI